jgi:hypothetical protein
MLLYQWDLSGQEIGSQYAGEIDPWARGVAEAVAERAEVLDARITNASDGWTADRLGAVERSALRALQLRLDLFRELGELLQDVDRLVGVVGLLEARPRLFEPRQQILCAVQ